MIFHFCAVAMVSIPYSCMYSKQQPSIQTRRHPSRHIRVKSVPNNEQYGNSGIDLANQFTAVAVNRRNTLVMELMEKGFTNNEIEVMELPTLAFFNKDEFGMYTSIANDIKERFKDNYFVLGILYNTIYDLAARGFYTGDLRTFKMIVVASLLRLERCHQLGLVEEM